MQITYHAHCRFNSANYDHENVGDFTLTKEIEDGADWKKEAEEIHRVTHEMFGDYQYLRDIRNEIERCKNSLDSHHHAIKLAHKRYEEMKVFMEAQGLGSKMPPPPYLPESFTELSTVDIKALKSSSDEEVQGNNPDEYVYDDGEDDDDDYYL